MEEQAGRCPPLTWLGVFEGNLWKLVCGLSRGVGAARLPPLSPVIIASSGFSCILGLPILFPPVGGLSVPFISTVTPSAQKEQLRLDFWKPPRKSLVREFSLLFSTP